MPRTLDQLLKSVSDTLFPADLGRHPVSINSRDCDGDTPLHVFAWRNDIEGAVLLIEAGAEVNAVGDMGETPLHVAIAKENVAMVSALLDAGARSDIRSEFGETPKEKARKRGKELSRPFRDK